MVASRHPDHLADDRNRQWKREVGNKVHPARGLHRVEQLIRDVLDMRAHLAELEQSMAGDPKATDEWQTLRQAYDLAEQTAGENKNIPGYLQLTDGVLDDPDLPMDLKVWLIVQRASSHLGRSDAPKGEREGRWLIETKSPVQPVNS